MKKLILLCLMWISLVWGIQGGEPYMIPFKDSLIFLVHGINSNRYTWYQSDRLGKPDLVNGDHNIWLHYLNKDLDIDDKLVFPYSFSGSSGYHGKNMLELGGVGYKSEGGDANAEGNNVELKVGGQEIVGKTGIDAGSSKTWLEQAEGEYKNALWGSNFNERNPASDLKIWNTIDDIPDALLPTKLVMLAHSQGNFAVRGYIQSGGLARNSDIFDRISDMDKVRLSPEQVAAYRANPLGFYTYPVEKVVFINPVLRGGSIETFLIIRAIKTLRKLAETKPLNIQGIGGSEQVKAFLDGLLIAAASDPDFLFNLGSTDFFRTLMTVQDVGGGFELMGVKPGKMTNMTNAELIVLAGDAGADVTDFLVKGIFEKRWGARGNAGPDWSQFGTMLATGFQKTVDGMLSPANYVKRIMDTMELVKDDNLFPGQSCLKGYAEVARALSPVLNPITIGRIVDIGFVNASAPSVGGKYHVGPDGTEKVLQTQVLDDDIRKLAGDYRQNKRKWQPKYRTVIANGSVAPDGEATRKAAGIEAGLDLARMGNITVPIPSIGGIDFKKYPYLGALWGNGNFWKLNEGQRFYATILS
ncbi:hypothetical protein EBR57_06560, partial [bacterium]|nr:hypothetical protein [bacterium]